jgi:hypothetical protein
MRNKGKAITALIVAILFAGTIFYCNEVVNDRNSQIASLNTQIANQDNEIANQNNEIANLTSQISNLERYSANQTYLTSANLVTAVVITELPANVLWASTPIYPPYSNLHITGSANNTGEGTAYNAGLHVVAYAADGTLEINMTVPLNGGPFGTDNAINAYLKSINIYGNPILGVLYSGQTVTIGVDIFHEGIVTNWTVTPVWTNSP